MAENTELKTPVAEKEVKKTTKKKASTTKAKTTKKTTTKKSTTTKSKKTTASKTKKTTTKKTGTKKSTTTKKPVKKTKASSLNKEIEILKEQHHNYELLAEEYNKERELLESLRIKQESTKSETENTEVLPEICGDNEEKTVSNEDFGFVNNESKQEEDDFADSKQLEEKQTEEIEKAKEETKAEQLKDVNFYNEDVEVEDKIPTAGKRVKKQDIQTFDYEDDNLAGVEFARESFNTAFKKHSIIKWVISTLLIVVLLLGWVLPGKLMNGGPANKTPAYITIGIAVACMVGMIIFSTLSKKKMNSLLETYFDNFYDFTYAYTFEDLDITNLEGNGHKQTDGKGIVATNLYKNVIQAPNRATYTFTYKDNLNCSISDCACYAAGEKRGSRKAVFVGKRLTTNNKWTGPDTVIYIKGNKRALPPTNLDAYYMIEDHKEYVICCQENRKTLNNRDKEFINKIQTNKVLVDCAIKLTQGTTTFMLGYEDTLMIPAHDRPFNPNPTKELKKDLEVCLEVAEHFNK